MIIKYKKKIIIGFLIMIGLLLSYVSFFFCLFLYDTYFNPSIFKNWPIEHFTQQLWLNKPKERYKIYKDLLVRTNNFGNMNETQIINLLGEPEVRNISNNDQHYFNYTLKEGDSAYSLTFVFDINKRLICYYHYRYW
jgi:hypothetical protein